MVKPLFITLTKAPKITFSSWNGKRIKSKRISVLTRTTRKITLHAHSADALELSLQYRCAHMRCAHAHPAIIPPKQVALLIARWSTTEFLLWAFPFNGVVLPRASTVSTSSNVHRTERSICWRVQRSTLPYGCTGLTKRTNQHRAEAMIARLSG